VIPEQAFDALFKAVVDERDPDAAMALWADDPDVTFWGSDLPERAVGRDAIRELLSHIASGRNRLAFRWDERRTHTIGDTAWTNASGTVAVNDTAPLPYRLTVVFTFVGDTWKIHTYQASIPA